MPALSGGGGMMDDAKCDAKSDTNCAALLAVAVPEGASGLVWLPWMRFQDGARKTALVLRRGRRAGGDVVLSFCPFCGGDVSVVNQEWELPRRDESSCQEGGE